MSGAKIVQCRQFFLNSFSNSTKKERHTFLAQKMRRKLRIILDNVKPQLRTIVLTCKREVVLEKEYFRLEQKCPRSNFFLILKYLFLKHQSSQTFAAHLWMKYLHFSSLQFKRPFISDPFSRHNLTHKSIKFMKKLTVCVSLIYHK